MQREVLGRYHMTDPNTWYAQSRSVAGAERPGQPGQTPETTKEPPYYLRSSGPATRTPVFSQTTVFVPRGRVQPRELPLGGRGGDQSGLRQIARAADVGHPADRRPGQTFNAMTNDPRSPSAAHLHEPGWPLGEVRQPADFADGQRSALRGADLHDAAGQHRTGTYPALAYVVSGSASTSASAARCRRPLTRCSPAMRVPTPASYPAARRPQVRRRIPPVARHRRRPTARRPPIRRP